MHGPQFGTPLYYAPFVERFPERIEQVLDAIEQAPPGGVLFHCVGGRDRTGMVAIAALDGRARRTRRDRRRLRASAPSARTRTTRCWRSSSPSAAPPRASSSWSWQRASTSTGRRYVAGLLSSELQR